MRPEGVLRVSPSHTDALEPPPPWPEAEASFTSTHLIGLPRIDRGARAVHHIAAERPRISGGRFVARAMRSPTALLKAGVSNGAISLQYIHSSADLSVLVTFFEKRLFSIPL